MQTDTPIASPTPRMPGAATWALIALILLAFVIQLLHAGSVAGPDIDALSKAGNVGYLTLTSEPWRLVTGMFMHGDWMHLLMNLAVLAYVGPLAEAVFGGRGSLAVFLAGGLLAGLASAIGGVAMAEQVNILGQVRYNLIVGVGASGAVMALCGALFAAYMLDESDQRHELLQDKAAISGLLPTVGLTLAFGFIRPSNDQVAHIGGLVAGAILGGCLLQTMHSPKRLVRALGHVGCAMLAILPIALWVPDPAAVELKAIAETIAEQERLEAAMPDFSEPPRSEERAQPLLPEAPATQGVGKMWSSQAGEF